MRILTAARPALISLALCSAQLGAIAADNHLDLANPGFEEGLKGWTATPEEAGQVLPEAASMGAKGLRLKSAGKFEVLSTPMPVTAGKSYTVSLWNGGGGAEKGTGVITELVFKDAAGKELKPGMASIRKWPMVGVDGGTYIGNTLLAAAAPEGAATMTIRFKSKGTGAAGAVDLDDIVVTELPDPGTVPVVTVAPGEGHPTPPFDPAELAKLLEEIKANPTRGKQPPKIVLKLDDLKPSGSSVHARWQKVADFVKQRNIKAAFGIIVSFMEPDNAGFDAWVKERNASGMIEFWNHGWDHAGDKTIMEFSGQPYEHQKDHMTKVQATAKEKLGFPLVSFGAPFNATDKSTLKVLEEDPDTIVWMYGDAKNPSGKTVLERSAVSLESTTLIADYANFVNAYAHNRGADYFVMQGHPGGWDDTRFEQFVKIVDFLTEQKAQFVLPREFAAKGEAAKAASAGTTAPSAAAIK